MTAGTKHLTSGTSETDWTAGLLQVKGGEKKGK